MISIAHVLLGLMADEPVKSTALNPLGWTFMIGSVGFVVLLTLWCFTKVLSLPTDPAEVAEGD
jgi:hypothetical protein